MVNPIESLEFLEKQSKSSSGIVMVLGYILLVTGFLFVYASTIDIIIKNKVWLEIGGAIVIIAIFVLLMPSIIVYKEERLSRQQKLYSSAIQMLKDHLDLQIKIIEYNEKAIAYNAKNKNPKMDILNNSDLCYTVNQYFDALFTKKPRN